MGNRRLWHGCCVAVLGLAAACATPPRVGPFVEATVEVRSAVVTAGSTVEAELKQMDAGENYAVRFHELWGTRVRAMDALVAYADSLQAIASAGEEGQEAVSAVADGVTQLAQAAGIALPAAGTVAVATDTAKFVYQQIALARSARSLEEALVRAQPAVEQIAVHIALDLAAAGEMFEAANTDVVRRIVKENNAGLGFREQLLTEQGEIYARASLELGEDDARQLLEIDDLLASTRTWYEPMQERLAQVEARRRAGTALFAATLDGVSQWGTAHRSLVVAVQERRPVNAASLMQAALEIRELVRRMREL